MRRAPHEGQNPRRLQLNATSLSRPQSAQRRRRRRKQCARTLALQEGIDLVTDELRQASASGLLGLSEEALGVLWKGLAHTA
jgi:hypothetical protein